jgi:hypothetical protein
MCFGDDKEEVAEEAVVGVPGEMRFPLPPSPTQYVVNIPFAGCPTHRTCSYAPLVVVVVAHTILTFAYLTGKC